MDITSQEWPCMPIDHCPGVQNAHDLAPTTMEDRVNLTLPAHCT